MVRLGGDLLLELGHAWHMRYWHSMKLIKELRMRRGMNVLEVHAICTVYPVGPS